MGVMRCSSPRVTLWYMELTSLRTSSYSDTVICTGWARLSPPPCCHLPAVTSPLSPPRCPPRGGTGMGTAPGHEGLLVHIPCGAGHEDPKELR